MNPGPGTFLAKTLGNVAVFTRNPPEIAKGPWIPEAEGSGRNQIRPEDLSGRRLKCFVIKPTQCQITH